MRMARILLYPAGIAVMRRRRVISCRRASSGAAAAKNCAGALGEWKTGERPRSAGAAAGKNCAGASGFGRRTDVPLEAGARWAVRLRRGTRIGHRRSRCGAVRSRGVELVSDSGGRGAGRSVAAEQNLYQDWDGFFFSGHEIVVLEPKRIAPSLEPLPPRCCNAKSMPPLLEPKCVRRIFPSAWRL